MEPSRWEGSVKCCACKLFEAVRLRIFASCMGMGSSFHVGLQQTFWTPVTTQWIFHERQDISGPTEEPMTLKPGKNMELNHGQVRKALDSVGSMADSWWMSFGSYNSDAGRLLRNWYDFELFSLGYRSCPMLGLSRKILRGRNRHGKSEKCHRNIQNLRKSGGSGAYLFQSCVLLFVMSPFSIAMSLSVVTKG